MKKLRGSLWAIIAIMIIYLAVVPVNREAKANSGFVNDSVGHAQASQTKIDVPSVSANLPEQGSDITLTADQTNLTQGQCTTLHYSIPGDWSLISIFGFEELATGSLGGPIQDSQQVCPTTTTTYTIWGNYPDGEKQASIVINVSAPPVTLTVVPVIITVTTAPISGPPPSPPSLISPGNGSSYPYTYDLTFQWNAPSGATQYKVDWWEGNNGQAQTSGWIRPTSFDIRGLATGITYSWHVKARNSSGAGDWSETWIFTIQPQQQAPVPPPAPVQQPPVPVPPPAPAQQPPAPPSLVKPGDNSYYPHDYDLTFQWSTSSGAILYMVQWWVSSSDIPQTCGWSSSTFCHLGILPPNRTYSWHVIARNNAGESQWSDTWSFTIQPSTPPASQPKHGLEDYISPIIQTFQPTEADKTKFGTDKGSRDCLAASTAMVLQALKQEGLISESIDYPAVRQEFRIITPNLISGLSMDDAETVVRKLTNGDVVAIDSAVKPQDWIDMVTQEIKAGFPVIARIPDWTLLPRHANHTPTGHFIMVYGLQDGIVYYVDPWDAGWYSLSTSDFEKALGIGQSTYGFVTFNLR